MNQKLRNLVYTAMLMALCCVATLVIKIPTVTGGYLNAGDIVVVLAALLAGPLYGGVAAGFGSGLADVISGYMSYAPGTLVVKGCAAVVAALIFRACRKKSFGFALLSAICGEIIMVLGYFVFEDFILGYGLAAAGEIPGNACQAAVGVAADHARDIHVPYPDHALAGVGGRRARCLRCRFGERLARRDAGVKRRERYERAGEQHNEGNFRCNGESRYP